MTSKVKSLLILALIVVGLNALISSAHCQTAEGGPYFSIKFGISGYEDGKLEQSGTIQNADVLGNFFTSAAAGYAWNFFRLETELAFRYFDLENTDIEFISSESSDINSESLTFMLNGYIDLNFFPAIPIYPYVMGGVGVFYADVEDFLIGPVDGEYDIDGGFAYQLGAGLSLPILGGTSLQIEYRYTRGEDLKLQDVFGVPYDLRYRSHVVAVGVTIWN